MSNSYERKQNTGTLFQNDKQNDRQPDFTGPILIDKSMIPLIERGVELRIAGWHKESASGLMLPKQQERKMKRCTLDACSNSVFRKDQNYQKDTLIKNTKDELYFKAIKSRMKIGKQHSSMS